LLALKFVIDRREIALGLALGLVVSCRSAQPYAAPPAGSEGPDSTLPVQLGPQPGVAMEPAPPAAMSGTATPADPASIPSMVTGPAAGASAAAPFSLPVTAERVSAPSVGEPRLLGTLAGVGATLNPAETKLYGTDLGISFEHAGKLYMIFGDTWTTPESLCDDGEPHNDDMLGTLPLSRDAGMPVLSMLRKTDDPTLPDPIQIFRGSESLKLGWLQVPLGGWSDGQRAFMLFDQMQLVSCDETAQDGQALCPAGNALSCGKQLGTCDPPSFADDRIVCDADRQLGCAEGQTCKKRPLCVDPTTSQYDDASLEGLANSVPHRVEIGVQRADEPVHFDTVHSWATRRFSQPALRTVARFTGHPEGNDYRPGPGALLIWGRPGYAAQEGREAQLYLMVHDLPLDLQGGSALRFEPRYFAGVNLNVHVQPLPSLVTIVLDFASMETMLPCTAAGIARSIAPGRTKSVGSRTALAGTATRAPVQKVVTLAAA